MASSSDAAGSAAVALPDRTARPRRDGGRDDKHFIIASLIAQLAGPRSVYTLTRVCEPRDDSCHFRARSVLGLFKSMKQATKAL